MWVKFLKSLFGDSNKPQPDSFKRKAVKMLERDEGRRNKLYKDTKGYFTIGIGWNLDANGLPDKVVDQLLEISLEQARKDAIGFCGAAWVDMSEYQKLALINMAFNLGFSRLMKFKTMRKHILAGDWESAKKSGENSLWANQVGTRSKRVLDLFLNKNSYGF